MIRTNVLIYTFWYNFDKFLETGTSYRCLLDETHSKVFYQNLKLFSFNQPHLSSSCLIFRRLQNI